MRKGKGGSVLKTSAKDRINRAVSWTRRVSFSTARPALDAQKCSIRAPRYAEQSNGILLSRTELGEGAADH